VTALGNISGGPKRQQDVIGSRALVVAAVLAALLVTPACAAKGPSGDVAIVTGVVLSGPRCPGPERVDSPCPPGPVQGAAVAASANGRVVASTHTDIRGQFRLSLTPGNYLLRAANVGQYRSTASHSVTVTIGHPVSVTLLLDTGIR
jgi:Carboxypeptidase regulatory-like domain